jgi:hypothetical protein
MKNTSEHLNPLHPPLQQCRLQVSHHSATEDLNQIARHCSQKTHVPGKPLNTSIEMGTWQPLNLNPWNWYAIPEMVRN